jgi:hypothetical protein
VPAEQGELICEERDIQERNDRLGGGEREGPQPSALAPRENDRGYFAGVQGSASLISITGMPSRIG